MTGKYIVYKITNNFECGIEEEIFAIFETEEEAIEAVEEEEEIEEDLGNGNVTFEIEYEYI